MPAKRRVAPLLTQGQYDEIKGRLFNLELLIESITIPTCLDIKCPTCNTVRITSTVSSCGC